MNLIKAFAKSMHIDFIGVRVIFYCFLLSYKMALLAHRKYYIKKYIYLFISSLKNKSKKNHALSDS